MKMLNVNVHDDNLSGYLSLKVFSVVKISDHFLQLTWLKTYFYISKLFFKNCNVLIAVKSKRKKPYTLNIQDNYGYTGQYKLPK